MIHCQVSDCNYNNDGACNSGAAIKTLEDTGEFLCIPWITPEERDKILYMDRPIAAEDVLQALEDLRTDMEQLPIRVIGTQEEVEAAPERSGLDGR